MAVLIGAAMVIGAVCFAGGSAVADGGYPPGTSVPSCTVGNVSAGNVNVGQTVTFALCGNFAPGATVTVTVNGIVALTKTPTDGAVVVVVTVASQSVLQVGDPVNVPAFCGTNSVLATGTDATGGSGHSTGTFNLVCSTATTPPTTVTPPTTATPGTSTTATPTSTTKATGGLAFTGARILEALLIALVLIVLGAALVALQRRRRQTF